MLERSKSVSRFNGRAPWCSSFSRIPTSTRHSINNLEQSGAHHSSSTTQVFQALRRWCCACANLYANLCDWSQWHHLFPDAPNILTLTTINPLKTSRKDPLSFKIFQDDTFHLPRHTRKNFWKMPHFGDIGDFGPFILKFLQKNFLERKQSIKWLVGIAVPKSLLPLHIRWKEEKKTSETKVLYGLGVNWPCIGLWWMMILDYFMWNP